uniref:Uncharacterized protein n=1 Tax=Nothobranchius furzeri TaxID=105023 RepID=A0A8C6LUZ9_NOTFU
MFISSQNSPLAFKCFTLVMVSVAIFTANYIEICYFHTGCLNPMVGNNNPHNSCKKDGEGLHCPAEGSVPIIQVNRFLFFQQVFITLAG